MKELQVYREQFTKRSFESFTNYVSAVQSEIRSFSVLGFTDLFGLPYDKYDYFISRAKWDEYKLNRRRRREDIVESGKRHFNLLIDDSAMRKFTSSLYYVAKNYIGNMGKIDNCMSCVFSCLSDGQDIIPVDFREYLARKSVGTKVLEFEFRSKLELAVSLIEQGVMVARENNIQIDYILFDTWYAAAWLLNLLDYGKLHYVTEIRPTRNLKLDEKKFKAKDLVKVQGLAPKVMHHRGNQHEVASVVATLNDLEHQVKVFVIKGKFCGKRQTRYFVTNDLSMTAEQAISIIGRRWDIDYFFREIKTYLAMADGKYHKLRCYRRHFYLCFIAWSQIQRIKRQNKKIRTTFAAVRWIRKYVA